jgi:hypothetical protein
MKPRPIENYVITPHARFEMQRRGIGEKAIRDVLTSPGQRQRVRPGRDVLQSKMSSGGPPKSYVLRVFVDVDRQPAEVVTAYRSSKIAKYWKEPK